MSSGAGPVSTPWQPWPKMQVQLLSRNVTSNIQRRFSWGSSNDSHSWATGNRAATSALVVSVIGTAVIVGCSVGVRGVLPYDPTMPPNRPEDVLDHVPPGADLIVPLANGEPVVLLDALEANAERLEGVRVHQMHA